jgi:hypothetical protein
VTAVEHRRPTRGSTSTTRRRYRSHGGARAPVTLPRVSVSVLNQSSDPQGLLERAYRVIRRFFTEQRSLRRAAASRRRRLRGSNWRSRVASGLRGLRSLGRRVARFGPTYVVVGIGLLWAPSGVVAPALRSETDAERFLETVWQVQAAAVGLTIAVVVFAFQALSSSRWSVGLREFADTTMLLPVVFLGSTSLVVDGLVLLGWGRDAPAGWAATWAVALAGVTLVSVPALFVSALRSIDPSVLRGRVLARLDREVVAAVDRNITERLGVILLIAWCDEVGFEFNWIARGRPGQVPVSAERPGVVTDIRLRSLRRLVSSYRARGVHDLVHITAHLRAPVSTDRSLLFLPAGSTDRDRRRAARAIKVSSARTSAGDLQAAFDGLHAAALEAIRGGEEGWYNEIREAYVRALTAVPMAWAEYGQRFDHGLAGGIFPLQLGDLDHVLRNIYSQLRQAVSADQSDIAASIVYLPAAVARDAIPLSAHGLSEQMLGLLVHMSGIAKEFPQHATAEVIELTLFEFIDYSAAARVNRDDLPTESRRDAADFVIEGFRHAANMIKAMIDRGDVARVPALLDRWDDVLQYWEPVDPARFERAAELAMAASPPDIAQAETAQKLLGPAQELAKVKRDIKTAHDQSYTELAAWLLRVLETDVTRPELTETLSDIASRLHTHADRSAAAEAAIDSDQLRNWIMFSKPGRGGQPIGADLYVLDAFVLTTLLAMSPGNAPSLVPRPWLLERAAALEETANKLKTWPHWHTLLAGSDADERVEHFKDAVRAAASVERRRQRSALLEAVPDPDSVALFQQCVREGFERSHVLPALFGRETASIARDTDRTPTFLGRDQYIPKDYFLGTSRVVNIDDFARSIGDNAAHGEMATVAADLALAPVRRLPAGSVRDHVIAAAGRLRADGYERLRTEHHSGSEQLAPRTGVGNRQS